MNGLKDVTKLVQEGGKVVDDVNYSGEERAETLNKRHETDMSSDSWLSKNIRPITLLFLLLCQGAIVVGMLAGLPTNVAIVSEVGALLFGAFGFYFNSKKGERIAEKNALANMKMNREQLDHEMKMEKQREKTERQRAKAAARLERIQARRGG